MTVPTDPYNFVNGTTADGDQVDARFLPLYTALNAALDVDNLLPALADKLGVSLPATPRRGASIVATEESRTNVAYGLMTTPDRVSGIVLPASGLLAVGYEATWRSSVVGAARASIFVGATQLKVAAPAGSGPAVTQAAVLDNGNASDELALMSFGGGLVSANAGSPYSGVTTGQAIGLQTGGILQPKNEVDGSVVQGTAMGGGTPWWPNFGVCFIFAAAGTYDVSVQFKASSGSVTAKNRKLWCWTMGF